MRFDLNTKNPENTNYSELGLCSSPRNSKNYSRYVIYRARTTADQTTSVGNVSKHKESKANLDPGILIIFGKRTCRRRSSKKWFIASASPVVHGLGRTNAPGSTAGYSPFSRSKSPCLFFNNDGQTELEYSRDTCNRSLPPSEREEEGISLSTEVTYVACVYRTVCDKLKCEICQSSKEE
ncbi:unnamed protein product [Larinioides sclopetarius]|uniref:Uncharacterized protein n=1 Tax=Larinioides sclopetarius TaxID=280406 RepID=A0AAV1Z2U0_9ARAC